MNKNILLLVKKDKIELYKQIYSNIGYTFVKSDFDKNEFVRLTFKKNKNIKNNNKINDILKEVEQSMSKIYKYERDIKRKNTKKPYYAYILSVLSILYGIEILAKRFSLGKLSTLIGVILIVSGLSIFALAYIIYRKKLNEKEVKIQSLLKVEYQNIENLCKKASDIAKK